MTEYKIVKTLLEERLKHNRKDTYLWLFSHHIVYSIAQSNIQNELIYIVYLDINSILSDCEIYHEMDRDKAIDAMHELSNFASLFVGYPKYVNTYTRICDLIQQLKLSYPV